MESPQLQKPSIYNGVSNRSRGWKTWKSQNVTQSKSIKHNVMKWDGASRTNEVWDNLRRDPELCFRDGDCFVHLHSKGKSHRGAAFRVPYSMLLEANFQPLIGKFLYRAHIDPAGRRSVDLFIPAPPESDKRQSYNYHLATRNLFAFIFRRPVVGECLGSTLITLMHNLRRFRSPEADNVKDLISYMEEEGYLDLNSQPTYALAMLRLAEAFQLRELYIEAFAHCCGMSARIFFAFEYQLLSQVTRTLIRRARREMHQRLKASSEMLKTFLHDAICKINIEVHRNARKHLDQFKELLEGFYTTQFGCYPPLSTDTKTTIFAADALHIMRNDFEALYEFLLDRKFNVLQIDEFLTEGHICILQSLKSFDTRYSHKHLEHPLPLLPDFTPRSAVWKRPWLRMPMKILQPRQADTLAALSRATNSDRPDIVKNHLVMTYRGFEEDQIISQTKLGSLENQDFIDGRKIRWILVYATYQTLLRVTDVVPQIRDVENVPYYLCISTADLPPWDKEQPSSGPPSAHQGRVSPSSLRHSRRTLEVETDDGHFTPISSTTCNAGKQTTSSMPENSSLDVGSEISISRPFCALRRSLSVRAWKRPHAETPKTSSQEDIICKDSNIINPSDDDMGSQHQLLDSSASVVTNSSSHDSSSDAKTPDTPGTSVAGSPVQSPIEKLESERAAVCRHCGLHDIDCDMITHSLKRARTRRVADDQDSAKKQTARYTESPPTVSISLSTSSQEHLSEAVEPETQEIRITAQTSSDIQMPTPEAPTAWDYIQSVMEVQASNYDVEVQAGLDQFSHLGNFIEVRSDTPPQPARKSNNRRATTMF
ncbi:hypothetical protein F4678DRAFT_219087 [Xylaria arbuscula]|nr:hypothetical protein F4678DRAFT_219087 [Xylaria arbuscula]